MISLLKPLIGKEMTDIALYNLLRRIPDATDVASLREMATKADLKSELAKVDKTIREVPRLFRPDEAANLGQKVNDIWTDIFLEGEGTDIDSYPTRKPKALLERIIKASTNEEDLVFDPFCGCGTAIDAAYELNRKWIGIDISSFAIKLIINERLKNSSVNTKGIPTDLASAKELAEKDRFAFEKWAITMISGLAPNQRQVADGGVDGRGPRQ